MREILTDQCQGQEQDKGCHSHTAEEAKGSQMEAKEVTFCCLPSHLRAAFILSRVPASIVKQLFAGSESWEVRNICWVWKFFYCERKMNLHDCLIDNRTR